jgi:hypothetical protein
MSGGGGGAGSIARPCQQGYFIKGGKGGYGIASAITGTITQYGGGGSGGIKTAGGYQNGAGEGGTPGGGGAGGVDTGTYNNGSAGTAYTGGGGGGAAGNNLGGSGGSGGSGIVVIRWPNNFRNPTSSTGSPTITTVNGFTIYKWTGNGSITF